jgi:hypothetical protein
MSAQIEAIGALFVEKLRAELPPAHFAEMQNLNSTADDGICHSHDYCDANVTMAAAFEQVVGREIDLQSDDDRALWSAAWRYALTHGLGQDAEIEAAAAEADATLGAVSVQVGQVVRIKPEWQDAGDENYTFTAITEPNFSGYFKARVSGGLFPSIMELHLSHVEAGA